MRTSFKREKNPKTDLQRWHYHAGNTAIAHPVCEATNGIRVRVFEKRAIAYKEETNLLKEKALKGNPKSVSG